MKKLLIPVLVLCLTGSVSASAGQPQNVYVNNVKVDSIVSNGKKYVSVDEISLALGVSVSKDAANVYLSIADRDEIIPEVIKSVSPSVVAIIGKYTPGNIPESLQKYGDRTAHGTGFVVKSDGAILTNAHVVENMENITVVLYDGTTLPAKVKYCDTVSDLAVVTVSKTGLTPIKFGSMSSVVAGKSVIAIGTPISFSLRNSASVGIISGLNRSLNGEYRLIQTDAAINQGNSGGPLVNLKGELIGVNSLKYAGYGIEGMCFSIPVDTVKFVLDSFYGYGKVMRPITGLTFEESWEAMHGLPTSAGLTVKAVAKGSPAEKSGLKAGDIVLKVNNADVRSIIDYNEAVKSIGIGGKIDFSIKRAAQALTISVSPNF